MTAEAMAREPARVLVADDDPAMLEVVAEVLVGEGYHTTLYNPASPDDSLLSEPCDVAVLDMVMPGTDGFELRRKVQACSPLAQFIFVTGYPDRDKLERAMDLGVFTFLTKPFTPDHIRYAVLGALRLNRLFRRNLERHAAQGDEDMGLIGRSTVMTSVRERILELAPLEIPVLVTGESGTGKEVVARCVHRQSPRARRRFTAINCAGLSPNLVEAELFGHAQGAFTGATKARRGFFEVSDGGTVFLDEIGDMPLELQSKLLRILDRNEFSRVGESSTQRVDVRVVSATNRDLQGMMKEGTFRSDLYYRLRGVNISLPPLRERREDIPALVAHFLDRAQMAVAPDAMEMLCRMDWPGNVRELSMVVTNLKGICRNRIVTRESVERVTGAASAPASPANGFPTYQEFKKRLLEGAEREYFSSLLRAADNNIAQAARRAGMHRKNLYEKLKQLGLWQV